MTTKVCAVFTKLKSVFFRNATTPYRLALLIGFNDRSTYIVYSEDIDCTPLDFAIPSSHQTAMYFGTEGVVVNAYTPSNGQQLLHIKAGLALEFIHDFVPGPDYFAYAPYLGASKELPQVGGVLFSFFASDIGAELWLVSGNTTTLVKVLDEMPFFSFATLFLFCSVLFCSILFLSFLFPFFSFPFSS